MSGNIRYRMFFYRFPGNSGNSSANTGIQQLQIVINLSGRSYSSPWISGIYYLLYGDGWGNTYYVVYLGIV